MAPEPALEVDAQAPLWEELDIETGSHIGRSPHEAHCQPARPVTMYSRPLSEIGCLTQAALFNFCLSEGDLRQLGAWSEAPCAQHYSPDLRSRARLHKLCCSDPEVAQHVTDLLDLQYLDTVVIVRAMETEQLVGMVDLCVRRPCGAALPALLWALCSDGREAVHSLGARLGHEAGVQACRAFIEEDQRAPLAERSPQARR